MSYPLTRLSVSSNGSISGPQLPAALTGQLEIINSVEPAREAVARALTGVSGLPDYGMDGMSQDSPACSSVQAWTPQGTTTIATTANVVYPTSLNPDSWRAVKRAFAAECPLIKMPGLHDAIDPPGDGSTNAPPSETVSDMGVIASAYGLCPPNTPEGEFCKLSYADGMYWSGRSCQLYYGRLRCMVY